MVELSREGMQVLYLRPLADCFRVPLLLDSEFRYFVSTNRATFVEALTVRSHWGNAYDDLNVGLLTGYNGLACIQQICRFGTDVERNLPILHGLLQQSAQVLDARNVKARWAGPMVLAAVLKFVWFEEALNRWPYDFSGFRLWPAGPTGPDCHAPCSEGTIVAKRQLRNIRRDVDATFLLLNGWSVDRIVERIQRGSFYPTRPAISEAISNVLNLVEIEPPTVRRGRRPNPSRSRLENRQFKRA
jgi:hypothetical protein